MGDEPVAAKARSRVPASQGFQIEFPSHARAILGEQGDPTNDSTAMWPEDNRKTVKLGTIAISAIQANAICDEKPTDPVANLPQGVAGPADDPMFEIRSPAYAISRGKRAQ